MNASDARPVLLEAKDLSVAYGKVEALHKVSLTIREGEIVTVIGPNGAGKTTLLSCLMGLLPGQGAVSYVGRSLGNDFEVEERVGLGLTLVPEKRELFSDMSVEDNLLLGAFDRYRRGDRDFATTMNEVYGIFPRLRERAGQMAGTLSGGERQMLAMGRALMARPRLLLLDEPSMGLAPMLVEQIFRTIIDINGQGTTVLLVEQNAAMALSIADRGYVIQTGRILLEDSGQNLLRSEMVRKAYLGEE